MGIRSGDLHIQGVLHEKNTRLCVVAVHMSALQEIQLFYDLQSDVLS